MASQRTTNPTARRRLTLAPQAPEVALGGHTTPSEGDESVEAVAQASVAQSSVAQSSVAQSSVAQSSVAQASVAQSSVAQASVAEASVAQSSVGPASVAQASPFGLSEGAGLLQVGELAKATGKTVRAIHLYENLGLIEPVGRSKGRYRLFAPDAKVRVRWISKLQSLGLSLAEIQDIVEQRASSESARLASEALLEVYAKKLAEVRASIAELRGLESELQASVEFLEACRHACDQRTAAQCCSSCSRHREPSAAAPELVVGAQMN